MSSEDPFARIKQQLSQLVKERSLTDAELVQVIDAVAELSVELSVIPEPTIIQKLMLVLGLMDEKDLWQAAYQQKMLELEKRLRSEQLEIVRQVIVQGVLGENRESKT